MYKTLMVEKCGRKVESGCVIGRVTGNEKEAGLGDTLEHHVWKLCMMYRVEECRRIMVMMAQPTLYYLPYRCDIFVSEWRAYASALLSHCDICQSSVCPPPVPPRSLLVSQWCKSRLLVLVDLNGTTILRTQTLITGIAPLFTKRVGDRNLSYYMRPSAPEMLQKLREHPRCQLAFYTSMRKDSALPAMRALGMKKLDVYDRKFNIPDPSGKEKHDTMRDLEKVWSTGGRVGSNHNIETTVLVDNTFRKVRCYPDNSVIVQEYTEQNVHNKEDCELVGTTEFLLNLLDACGYSVRSFLQVHPFSRRNSKGSAYIKGLWALFHSGPMAGRFGECTLCEMKNIMC